MSRHAPVGPILTVVYLISGVAAHTRSATRNAGYLDRAPDNAVLIGPGTRLKFLCPTWGVCCARRPSWLPGILSARASPAASQCFLWGCDAEQ
jgi:hypothetical protein